MIAIVIATYQRADGRTPFYLTRLLDSIFHQNYQEFKVFLIGDYYDNAREFYSIIDKYEKSKIYIHNLPVAKERTKYKSNSLKLWCSGGVNATNFGIKIALKQGFQYICCPDHDDYWTMFHLAIINKVIKVTQSPWICTKSIYNMLGILPKDTVDNFGIKEFLPFSSGLIKSSVCMDFKKIPFLYRDVFAEEGYDKPADADLWDRCSVFLRENNMKSYLIDLVTCIHEEEGFVLRGGEQS